MSSVTNQAAILQTQKKLFRKMPPQEGSNFLAAIFRLNSGWILVPLFRFVPRMSQRRKPRGKKPFICWATVMCPD
jgi:hypothetical protein